MSSSSNNILNVLHFIDHYRIGGPGRTILNSSKFINKNRFHIHIAIFVDKRHGESEFSIAIKKGKIPFLMLSDKRGISIKDIICLKNYIKKNKIKILHTHGYKADFIGVILKFLIKNCILVSTYHGWIKNNIFQKVFIQFDLKIGRFFDGIIVVANYLKKELFKHKSLQKKCHVIHNALVLSDHKKQNLRENIRIKYSIKENEILIGVIGRLSIEKGVLEMLDAFIEINKEYNNTKIIFVGEGPLKKKIKCKIESLNNNQSIILAGYKNPVGPIYEGIDILVCPSRTEGLSNVILEGLVYSLPVIATDVGGNPEIIEHEKNGLLVRKGDKNDINNAIAKLINNYRLKNSLSKKGYDTVKNRFNFKNRMKEVENFYEKLLYIQTKN